MPWIKKEYNCGRCVMVTKCFASRYGAKGQRLHIRTSETTTQQQSINDRAAMQRYSILANANFTEGDYYITYTFKRGALPETAAECKTIWKAYRRKLRAFYKKQGKELKYLYTFEYEGTRPHFHIIINNDDINLKDLPKWEYGKAQTIILDDRDYHTIGEYFVKVCYSDNGNIKGDIGSSRNLIRPQPKITILSSSMWLDIPKAKKGYYLDKSTLINGYTEVITNGYLFRYQSYVMIKIE